MSFGAGMLDGMRTGAMLNRQPQSRPVVINRTPQRGFGLQPTPQGGGEDLALRDRVEAYHQGIEKREAAEEIQQRAKDFDAAVADMVGFGDFTKAIEYANRYGDSRANINSIAPAEDGKGLVASLDVAGEEGTAPFTDARDFYTRFFGYLKPPEATAAPPTPADKKYSIHKGQQKSFLLEENSGETKELDAAPSEKEKLRGSQGYGTVQKVADDAAKEIDRAFLGRAIASNPDLKANFQWAMDTDGRPDWAKVETFADPNFVKEWRAARQYAMQSVLDGEDNAITAADQAIKRFGGRVAGGVSELDGRPAAMLPMEPAKPAAATAGFGLGPEPAAATPAPPAKPEASPAKGAQPQGKTKIPTKMGQPMTPFTARHYLKQAGGDPQKALALAKADGWRL